jgi:hypothetical protein
MSPSDLSRLFSPSSTGVVTNGKTSTTTVATTPTLEMPNTTSARKAAIRLGIANVICTYVRTTPAPRSETAPASPAMRPRIVPMARPIRRRASDAPTSP